MVPQANHAACEWGWLVRLSANKYYGEVNNFALAHMSPDLHFTHTQLHTTQAS